MARDDVSHDAHEQTAQRLRIEALARELVGPDSAGAEVRVVGDAGEVTVADVRMGWARCVVYVRGDGAMDAAESALLAMLRRRTKTGGTE